jgi:hypothetical protein
MNIFVLDNEPAKCAKYHCGITPLVKKDSESFNH